MVFLCCWCLFSPNGPWRLVGSKPPKPFAGPEIAAPIASPATAESTGWIVMKENRSKDEGWGKGCGVFQDRKWGKKTVKTHLKCGYLLYCYINISFISWYILSLNFNDKTVKATWIPSVEVLSRTVSSLRIRAYFLLGMNPPPAQGFVNLSAVYVSQVLHRASWKKRLQVDTGRSRFQNVGRSFLFCKIQSPINLFHIQKWQVISDCS